MSNVVYVEVRSIMKDNEGCDIDVSTGHNLYSVYLRVGTEEENFAKWVADFNDPKLAKDSSEALSEILEVPVIDFL